MDESKVKAHFKKHAKFYIIAASCLTAGYLLRDRSVPPLNAIPVDVPPELTGSVWIADHVMQGIHDTGMAEVVMETGEVINLTMTGVK